MFTHAQRTATADVAKALPLALERSAAPPLAPPLGRHARTRWARRCRATWVLRHARFVRDAGDQRSPHRLEHCGHRSSRSAFDAPASTATTCSTTWGTRARSRIVPEFQDIAEIGDRVAMAEPVNDVTAFTVAGFESLRSVAALAEARQHLGVAAGARLPWRHAARHPDQDGPQGLRPSGRGTRLRERSWSSPIPMCVTLLLGGEGARGEEAKERTAAL